MHSPVKIASEGNVYLGRQPIYGARREIRAYELLYRRHASDTTASFQDPDQASADVMLKAFLEIGLAAVSPERPVFINHTRHLLALDPILPADRCVVEVLEDVTADPDTVACLHRLKSLNYRIALDDFVYDDSLLPMIEIADYIKLDLLALGAGGFHEQMNLLHRFDVRIVAEKIESEAEFRWCRKIGCDLFQGYYLRRPEVLVGRRIPSSQLSVLSLLAECADLESSAGVIAAIIARDAPLTYGLLRLANSALYRHRSEIRSPAQAVTLLGMDFVFRWATLLALSGNDDCPAGYLEAALQRARMAELLGVHYRCSSQEAYIAGLLSTLDAIFNAPLEELIVPLPIDIRFKRAILQREGALGGVLDAVLAYESGEFSGVDLADAAMQRAFWEAAEYARAMISQMSAAMTG
uniref:Diguanylate phosphodiesterase n=1 Tax=Solibacter usitatus (strain Ellin6076) TaxID=234267 RepID=Q01WS9_SOLUE